MKPAVRTPGHLPRWIAPLGCLLLGALLVWGGSTVFGSKAAATSTPAAPPNVIAIDAPPTADPAGLAVVDPLAQSGESIGSASAPITLIMVADMQCPACKQSGLGLIQDLLRNQVRSGQLRIVRYNITITGDESVAAARMAAAAAQQNKMWQFLQVYDLTAGAEGAGSITTAFLNQVAASVPGLNATRAEQFAASSQATAALAADRKKAAQLGAVDTPTFYVGRTGRAGVEVPTSTPTDVASIDRAINQVAAGRQITTTPPPTAAAHCSATACVAAPTTT